MFDIIFFCFRDQGSDSEGEELGGEGDVILPQDLPGRGNALSQQSVVKLSEVRLKCGGFMLDYCTFFMSPFLLAWTSVDVATGEGGGWTL